MRYDVWKTTKTPFGKRFVSLGFTDTAVAAMNLCNESGPGHYRICCGTVNRKYKVHKAKAAA